MDICALSLLRGCRRKGLLTAEDCLHHGEDEVLVDDAIVRGDGDDEDQGQREHIVFHLYRDAVGITPFFLGFTSEHRLDYLWPPLLVIRFFQSIIVGQAFLVPGRLFYWRRGDAAMGIDRGALTFWCNRGRLEIQKSEPPRGGRSDVW